MILKELNHRINFALRSFKAKMAKIILDRKPHPSTYSVSDFYKFKHICFLRNDDKLGDMIISTFAFREIKKQFPNLKIIVIAGKNNSEIIKRNPYVDNIYIYERNFLKIFKLGIKLKKDVIDLYIDLDQKNTIESIILLKLANPIHAFGFNRQNWQLYDITENIDYHSRHITQCYDAMFERIGISPTTKKNYDIFLQQEEIIKAKKFLLSLPKGRMNIGINAFAGSRHRTLTYEQILELTNNMSDSNCILLGIHHQTAQLYHKGGFKNNVYLLPKDFGLYENFAIIRQLYCLITPDTSYTHVACAFDTPQVAIYRKNDLGNYKLWKPLSNKAAVIFAPDDYFAWDATDFTKEVLLAMRKVIPPSSFSHT